MVFFILKGCVKVVKFFFMLVICFLLMRVLLVFNFSLEVILMVFFCGVIVMKIFVNKEEVLGFNFLGILKVML